jgi:hypothetical protein
MAPTETTASLAMCAARKVSIKSFQYIQIYIAQGIIQRKSRKNKALKRRSRFLWKPGPAAAASSSHPIFSGKSVTDNTQNWRNGTHILRHGIALPHRSKATLSANAKSVKVRISFTVRIVETASKHY